VDQVGLATVLTVLIQSVVSALTTLIPVLIATANSRRALSAKLDACMRAVSMLSMHDEHLDIETRLAAGDDFISAGGNGAGKTFHKELQRQYAERLRERGTE
jgi:hypothetical protein